MRTCLPLTPELQTFYDQMMGEKKPDEEEDEDDLDDKDQEPDNSLMPKKRRTRNIVS